MVERFLAFCGRAYGHWRAIKERWWYLTAALPLAVILAGPRQFLADRIENLNTIISLPDHLWGKWLAIITAFALIIIGILRSNRIAEAVAKKETETRLDFLRVPMAEMANFGELRKIIEVDAIYARLRSMLTEYGGVVEWISTVSELRQFEWSFGNLKHFDILIGNFGMQKTAACILGEQITEPNLLSPDLRFIDGEEFNNMGRLLTQNSRIELETACKHNLQQLKDSLGWLEYAITKKREKVMAEAARPLQIPRTP